MDFIKNYWFLIVLLTVATVLSFVWLYFFNKKKLNASWWEILLVALVHTLYGVLTVKFFAILEAGFDVEKAGNMSLFGGIFFMPIMYFVYAKIKKLPVGLVFDIFVVPLAATLFLARVNCFFSGCCKGIFLGDSDFRWPAREVDLFVHLSFLALIIPLIQKNKSKGIAYPLYMAHYGLFRFINEWFRESDSFSSFHIGHVWAIISFVVGATILLIKCFRQNKGDKSWEEHMK